MRIRTLARNLTIAVLACLLGACAHVAPRELGEKDFTPAFLAKCRKEAEAGDPNGQALYGKALFNGWGVASNHVAAIEWLDKAVDAGNASAQLFLGCCYEAGVGVERDMDKAFELYAKAAAKGSPLGQFALGECYAYGKVDKRNYAKAFSLYKKAANQGLAVAQHSLGVCYRNGRGVERKPSVAVKWFTKAADKGLAQAQYSLGQCYYYGEGVRSNHVKAVEFWMKAVAQGHDDSRAKLFDLAMKGDIFAKEALSSLSRKLASFDTSWTADNTERFWNEVAALATRTSTAPRLTTADAREGEKILEAFGTRFLPNAYARYQKARMAAKEREATFNENRRAAGDSTQGDIYDKMVAATAKVVSEMDRRHDELCHYYLLFKAGVITETELASVDSSKIGVMLSGVGGIYRSRADVPKLSDVERSFAEKHMPLALAGHDRLADELSGSETAYAELVSDAVKIDAVRGDGVLKPLRKRLADIRLRLGQVVDAIRQNKLMLAADEVTAEQLANLDKRLGAEFLTFEQSLAVRDAQAWFAKHGTDSEKWDVAFREAPVFGLLGSMAPIEDKGYAMCKYEVTQGLWVAIMGENPSCFKGSQLPVETVTWNESQEFLRRLNSLPEVKEAGLRYRLPLQYEWRYACAAGAKGCYGSLAGDVEVTDETFGDVAWNIGNSNGRTHIVGLKKPNAFGLYDMHGNVWEWTATSSGGKKASCGGSWENHPFNCGVESTYTLNPGTRRYNIVGLRLAL